MGFTSGDATRLDVKLLPANSFGARFSAKVNFQAAGAPTPTGFDVDSGAAFGLRTGSLTYGWESTLAAGSALTRDTGRSQDPRYDTLCRMQAGGGNHTWEIAVPSGVYSVLVAAGDPTYALGGTYRLNVENVPLLDAAPATENPWVEAVGTVVVTDGRLTVSNAPGATDNRLAFVEVSSLPPSSIEQWRAVHFATTSGAGMSGDAADPDSDDIINLEEYAFDRDPLTPDANPLLYPVFEETNGVPWLGCRFMRNAYADDLTLRVEAATSLLRPTWTPLAESIGAGTQWVGSAHVRQSPGTHTPVSVTVMDPNPSTESTNRYLRLKVTRP